MKAEDLADFHAYRSLPEIMIYQGSDIMNIEQAKVFIARQTNKKFGKPGEWVQYVIEDTFLNRVVGDCAIKLQTPDPRIAEIGMTISNKFQRNGYAKEALLEILRFLFEVKRVHRVEETTDVENVAATALLENVGFRKEGHFIENIFFNGKWGSEYQFAMLKSEWVKRNL